MWKEIIFKWEKRRRKKKGPLKNVFRRVCKQKIKNNFLLVWLSYWKCKYLIIIYLHVSVISKYLYASMKDSMTM